MPKFTTDPSTRASVLFGGGATIVGGGAAAGGSASTSSPPTDLQTILSAIPRAEEGHIITSEYHNSLRDAILLLASQAGGEPVGVDTTFTYAPIFLSITDGGVRSPEWSLALGIASRPQNDQAAQGWFPVHLPEGASIRALTVTGKRSGNVLSCSIKLMRFTVSDATTVPLITISLKDVSGEFKKSSQFSATVPPDFQIVDNEQYQYLIVAELARAAQDAVVDLYSFQILCGLTGS